MARLLILGAGIAGQTAALHAKHLLGSKHQIIIVSPNSKWNWIPSNIWVGVGIMGAEDVTFELAPVYKRLGIQHEQAKAVSIHPEGDSASGTPYVKVSRTNPDRSGASDKIQYDYLINATDPNSSSKPRKGWGLAITVCRYVPTAMPLGRGHDCRNRTKCV